MWRRSAALPAFALGLIACSPGEGVSSPNGGSPGALGGNASGGASPNAGGAPADSGGRSGDGGKTGAGGAAESTGGTLVAASGGNVMSVGGQHASDGGQSGGTSGSGGGTLPFVPVKELPRVEEMPDPLVMHDGTPVTTPEQWCARRQEMIQLLEDYEYGHMPPPPGNVTATTMTETKRVTVSGSLEADYRMLQLHFGPEQKLGFDLGIFVPTSGDATSFPTLITLASNANEKSGSSAAAALTRGYAVVTIPYSQLGADSTDWNKSPFFVAYPDYDWRDFSAWAWGISRAVDYLVTDPQIDSKKLIVTGVSRLGQAALLVGAFDERIAMSAPVAGGMAFRFSGKEMGGGLGQGITEIVDQNTYWFGPIFPQFRNQTPKLPSDQHWLVALTSPRLFIMSNSFDDQYGRAYAAVQTYVYAKPVFDLLQVGGNVGLNFREGTHGSTSEDWSAILDFADQKLLGKSGDRKFDVIPPKEKLP